MTADEELFREWQQGGAGALEALVRRHHAPLLAHLYRLVGDHALAEDLAQETFLRLVRDAHAYRYPRPFAPWFYTIARNLARNHWQSAYHRRVAVGADLPEVGGHASVAPAGAPDPAAWLERLERREGLSAALGALTFEQREILSLRYGQGLPVGEVASLLGLPPGTVKSRTFTALRRLRALLARGDADDAAPESRVRRPRGEI
jgi:RNA polymerase sigma-70 factor (ECF subfamily)